MNGAVDWVMVHWWIVLVLWWAGMLTWMGEVPRKARKALKRRHKRRLELARARAAHRANTPPALPRYAGPVTLDPPMDDLPPTVCGCTHHLAFHDPATGRCHGVMPGESAKRRGCTCRQYTGPELLGRVMPPPVIDPDEPY